MCEINVGLRSKDIGLVGGEREKCEVGDSNG